MRPSKWNCVTVLALLLIPRSSGTDGHVFGQNGDPENATMFRSSHSRPFWEDVLREFVFRTVSPSPTANHALYKRILEAPFYGGPFPEFADGTDILVLSRGDVHHLPNGRWLMCQEGCFECKPCVDRKNPTVKWSLRRIKRLSSHNSLRYDFQITITAHRDDTFHAHVERNLSPWPRSYVYVTTQPEEFRGSWMDKDDPWLSEKYPFSSPVDGLPVWRSVKEDSLRENNSLTTVDTLEISDVNANDKDVIVTNIPIKTEDISIATSTTQPPLIESTEKNRKERRQHVRLNISDERQSDRSTPQLILGRDGLGNKRLVHVIPAEFRFNLSAPILKDQNSVDAQSKYRQLFQAIFESLNNNKDSIERFLREQVINDNMYKHENFPTLPLSTFDKNTNDMGHSQDVERKGRSQTARNSLDVSQMLRNHLDVRKNVHNRLQQNRRRPVPSFRRRVENFKHEGVARSMKTIAEKSVGSESNRTDDRNDTGSRSQNETDRTRFNEASTGNDSALRSEAKYVPRGLRVIVTTESTTIERSRVVNDTATKPTAVEKDRGRSDSTNDTVSD